MNEATSSMPVQVLGLNNPPEAGDSFVTVESDDKARELCDIRNQIKKLIHSPKLRTWMAKQRLEISIIQKSYLR